MNLDDEGGSPWSDERSNSPLNASNGQETEARTKPTPSPAQSAPTLKAPTKTPGGRAARTPRKYGAQPTRLEAIDNTLDPLGPLGQTAKVAEEPEPPALPQKEAGLTRNQRSATTTSQGSTAPQKLSAELDDEGRPTGRYLDPAVSTTLSARSQQEQIQRQQPSAASVNVDQRPSFQITVGDPHKVGDLTGSHTAYQQEMEVSRRYRDFLWLYNQLHSNNPGTIVPPPPEKQAMGRYESDFVEGRRYALEKMLSKTALHPTLHQDPDFRLFLESDAFSVDVKQREKKDPDMPTESKGILGGLSIGVNTGPKFVEHDEWFLDRRTYLDNTEAQFKSLLKSTESAVLQRRHLSEACNDLSTSLNALSQVEISPSLTGPLASLSDLQLRVRDLYARQAQQDVLTLTTVIDEYIRLIGSVKKAFDQRQRSWQLWHNAESDLQKRRAALDKLHRQGRTQQDRIATLQADVADAERRAHQARLTFEDLGRGMRAELERFEREKVEDFRMGVETYLESAVEAQKELIELWETFLLNLDTDTAENVESTLANLGAATPVPTRTPHNPMDPIIPSLDGSREGDSAVGSSGAGDGGKNVAAAGGESGSAEAGAGVTGESEQLVSEGTASQPLDREVEV